MTAYIVDIEAVDSRYTRQWKQHLPKQLERYTNSNVIVISGGEVPQATTPGAFLNFAGTNNYKSQQMLEISRLFAEGNIKDGDYFLYTDAWNPTVIQLRYMAELLGIDIRIGGMWHAGSYDPHDFLGRLIGDKPWVRQAELSMYNCYNDNYFATKFHIDMFADAFANDVGELDRRSMKRVGWPMEYLHNSLEQYKGMQKRDLILFPHRIAPEKQIDIFRDLKEQLPQYEFVVCQDQELTKNEYHNLLGEAKIVFSANLQETLGISWYEGAIVGALPMVPNRLSYSEMAVPEFKYPKEWTSSVSTYNLHKEMVIAKIIDYMENYDSYLPVLVKQIEILQKDFFSGKLLYEGIKNEQ